MKTVYTKITDLQSGQEQIEQAGRILREGGIVAIPTETVYGLGANALNGQAVKKFLKQREDHRIIR